MILPFLLFTLKKSMFLCVLSLDYLNSLSASKDLLNCESIEKLVDETEKISIADKVVTSSSKLDENE